MIQKQTSKQKHTPVLLKQVVELLNLKSGGSYLDLTAGRGGHAAAILEHTDENTQAVLVDRDREAIDYLQKEFVDDSRVSIMHSDFSSAAIELEEKKMIFDAILLDLGVSSPQLDNPKRGFSFKESAPLDMRMDQKQSLTADDLVNHLSETELADLIYRYGGEHFSRRIARAIVARRPIRDTKLLAEVIARAVPKQGKINPATKTFQALRIVVNDELNQLESTLTHIPHLLNQSGRVAVISFHSLEDRIVKQFFRNHSELEPLTKKPISGSSESFSNPRSRSAKLRVAVKTNNAGDT